MLFRLQYIDGFAIRLQKYHKKNILSIPQRALTDYLKVKIKLPSLRFAQRGLKK